jgi:hypothetical protein
MYFEGDQENGAKKTFGTKREKVRRELRGLHSLPSNIEIKKFKVGRYMLHE